MKIKRYMAASMRAALDQVRVEQGPDAVILSSRRMDEGVEVIAAVDYDEALIAGAARQYALAANAASAAKAAAEAKGAAEANATAPSAPAMAGAPVAARTPAAPSASAAPRVSTPAKAPAAGAARPRDSQMRAPAAGMAQRRAPSALARDLAAVAVPDSHHGFATVQRELKDLRHLLETELAGISWNDKRMREPLKARVLEELSAMDIAPDVAASLAAMTPSRTKLEDTSKLPLALLLRHLPVVDQLSTVNGGVFALVGPTGAGKTTTIAKLASRWCMRHGSDELALVSTDSYRIGAREQLMTYARILGAGMHAPNSGRELARVLDRLKSKRLVLIDTAGMGPRDVRLGEQLEALQAGALQAGSGRTKVLLTLPAPGEGHALEEIMRAFAPVSPAACIITKVDEAASLGAVMSTILRHKLKIAYLCNGQRVPEDLHPAHARRVWLVRAAQKLMQHAPLKRDAAYYARNFGRAPAHA